MNECACGCGYSTDSTFTPGHDGHVVSCVIAVFGDVAGMAKAFGFGPGLRNARAECGYDD